MVLLSIENIQENKEEDPILRGLSFVFIITIF